MHILVTGGAGFIGANLVRRLLQEGHRVTVLDNLETGSHGNLAGLEGALAFLEGDVTRPPSFPEKFDRIYHLACPASPPQYQKDPVRTLTTNVVGTLAMLDLAAASGARFLQASTSEIYGDPLESPQKESYWGHVNPVGPRSCYDEGKRAAETAVMDHGRTRGTDARVVRIFNTYGPFMDPADGRVVSNFIVQALKGEPLTIYGDGSQTRSFQYIDDLVEGMIRMMENEAGFAGPVNLGNPEEFSVRELAAEVLRLIPESKSALEEHPLPLDDPKRRLPDISIAKEKLDWEPRINLASGLQMTIPYFRKAIHGT